MSSPPDAGTDARSSGAKGLLVTKSGPFTGRMRSAEALLAIGMGLGGAVLAVVAARCEAA